ncbi:MAG TPA: hypothetical protein VND19_13315 [Acetobacteraceae bacterium]|nr:hypothetical protein [Acetobacteraceae bacterium]
MSAASTKARAPSFFDLYRRGEATAEGIEDFVRRWHYNPEPGAGDLPLHDYFGPTREEYEVLPYDAEALPQVLAARESQRPLAGLMAARLRELKAANRPEDATTIVLLGNWLAAQGVA